VLIDKLAADPNTDELNTLHPLITQCRWVFGPEYESAEYSSNVTLRTAALKLFKKLPDQSTFKNSKKRPDIIVLPNSTISLVGTEKMEEEAGIVKLENVLIIELKKGDSSIGREEMNQADGYVQDILSSDLLDSNPQVRAFVVGHRLDPKTDPVKNIGDPTKAKIKAVTFGQITRTAEQRLFKLKKHLSDRYDNISDSSILDEVLNNPEQDLNFKKA
jgi:hypothetical protein